MTISTINDVSGNPIDPLWAAEFRGLFWGEGCLSVSRTFRTYLARRTGETYLVPIYRVSAIISLRKDDAPMLTEIQKTLGGNLHQKPIWSVEVGKRNPCMRWYSTSRSQNVRIAALLSDGILPAKKAKELELWTEAATMMQRRGYRRSPEEHERLIFIWKELHRQKGYQGSE